MAVFLATPRLQGTLARQLLQARPTCRMCRAPTKFWRSFERLLMKLKLHKPLLVKLLPCRSENPTPQCRIIWQPCNSRSEQIVRDRQPSVKIGSVRMLVRIISSVPRCDRVNRKLSAIRRYVSLNIGADRINSSIQISFLRLQCAVLLGRVTSHTCDAVP